MLALCGAACGPPAHGPYFGDDRLIVLGVSPDAEADALSQQLNQRGLREARRIRGKTYTALGLGPDADPAHQTDVRVITGRGITLALEGRAATVLQSGESYALLQSPALDTLDADHGDDDLFVARTMLPAGSRCILIYRVLDTGAVDAVAGDDYALLRVPDADPAWREPFCTSKPVKRPPRSPAPKEAVTTRPQ